MPFICKFVKEGEKDDLVWADAIIFSTPTRFGSMASQMKQFLDRTGEFWAQGKLVNKVVNAMSSAQNPYGTSVTVDQNGKMIEDVQADVKHQAKRTVTVAQWVKSKINIVKSMNYSI